MAHTPRNMRRFRCRSGLVGYSVRLRDNYASFDRWAYCSDIYGLAHRLGYENALDAWRDNPRICGSVIPSDFNTTKKGRYRKRSA